MRDNRPGVEAKTTHVESRRGTVLTCPHGDALRNKASPDHGEACAEGMAERTTDYHTNDVLHRRTVDQFDLPTADINAINLENSNSHGSPITHWQCSSWDRCDNLTLNRSKENRHSMITASRNGDRPMQIVKENTDRKLLSSSSQRLANHKASALTSLAARMMVLICERSPHSARNVSVNA